VSAQQRAAQVAAGVQRSRASVDMARGVRLPELGVWVKGNEVRKNGLTWNTSVYLGSLVGACAGIMDVKPPSGGALLSSVVIGNVPRVGTIFVAFADGKRNQIALSQGSRAQMRKVDDAVARFNAMVDIVDREAQKTPPPEPQLSGRTERVAKVQQKMEQVRVDIAGLTYRECKPGRDAFKAARRAGLSRDQAAQASRDALARVRESKAEQQRKDQ
jgi:hypothetical protein